MLHCITGAAGFIGFHLARRLLERGDEVVGVDCLNEYYNPALKMARLAELGIGSGAGEWGVEIPSSRYGKLTFLRLSLEDREGMEGLFASRRFDRVCNLAAQAGVRYSLVNPRAYLESNITGFLNVLECCRETQYVSPCLCLLLIRVRAGCGPALLHARSCRPSNEHVCGN